MPSYIYWEDIRESAYQALRARDEDSWPMIALMREDFFVYETWTETEVPGQARTMLKQTYTLSGDVVTLVGEPVEVDRAFVKKGTMQVVASRVVAGAAASELLAELKEKNPLFAALDGTGNTSLVVFDLTTAGRPSHHQGRWRYNLATAGLAAALPTLIGKPIHATAAFDAHVAADAEPRAIGVFLGAEGLVNPDGTVTVRAVGNLWSRDFPDAVDTVKSQAAIMGASYELLYASDDVERQGNILTLKKYEFTGGAILQRNHAAHPESQVHLVAGTDDDFALIQADASAESGKARRFPIGTLAERQQSWTQINRARVGAGVSPVEATAVRQRIMRRAQREQDPWAKDYAQYGGRWMQSIAAARQGGVMPDKGKYEGIPDELQGHVAALIATAAKDHELRADKATAEVEKLTAEREALKGRAEQAEAAVAAGAEALKAVKAELDTASKELVASKEQLAAAATEKATLEAKAFLKAEHGLNDKQIDERKDLLAKYVAGQALTLAELGKLTGGGTKATVDADKKPASGSDTTLHDLAAGNAVDRNAKPDPKAVAAVFPAAVRHHKKAS